MRETATEWVYAFLEIYIFRFLWSGWTETFSSRTEVADVVGLLIGGSAGSDEGVPSQDQLATLGPLTPVHCADPQRAKDGNT